MYYANGSYYDPEVGLHVDASEISSIIDNAFTLFALDRNGIMCDNILAYLPYVYSVFTTQELSVNPLYDPDANKPFWELWWNGIVAGFAWLVRAFNNLDIGWKIGIGLALFALACIITALLAYYAGPHTAAAVWKALSAVFLDFAIGVVSAFAFTAISMAITGDFSLETLGGAVADAIFWGGVFAFVTAGINWIKIKVRTKRAIKISRNAAIDRAKELQTVSGKKPTMTSAVVDVNTGKIYYGDSGNISNNINSILADKMPRISQTKWPVANCAEFNAVNNALNAGASMNKLVVTTVRVKTLALEPMCLNCQVSLRGVLLVISG